MFSFGSSVSIRNPGTFYFSDKTYDYDWTSPRNDALWRDEEKVLFDPCPAGWRVPRGGEEDRNPWSAFTADNGTLIETAQVDVPGSGRRWSSPQVYGGSAWYGMHPHRPVGALQMAPASSTLLWTSTTVETLAFRCNFGVQIVTIHSAGRTNGLTVRCIRE